MWPMIISAALSVGGTLLSAKGQRDAGKAAQQQSKEAAQNELVSSEFEAQQADFLAGQARASGQRQALEQRRVAGLMGSRVLALAAASGAGASDEGVVNIVNNIYAEGAYRSAMAMYEGEAEARNLGVAAQARRLGGSSAASAAIGEGKSSARAANTNMFSTLLSGGGSFLKNYGELFE